jgi:MFS family permease
MNNSMNITTSRWIILGASCFINLCIGSLYSWSVFVAPMADYLSSVTGRTIVSLSIVFTIANCVGPVTMISGGYINDKVGPKWLIRFGALIFCGGMIFSGFAKTPGMLIIGYGLGVGLGNGVIYGCNVSNTIKFFPERRGLVGGLTSACYGISSILMPPIASQLINNWGVTATFKILGMCIFALILSASLLIKACPLNFKPEGRVSPQANTVTSEYNKKWTEMIMDPGFYIMFMVLLCGAFSGIMVISQASPIAQNMVGLSSTAAAFAVSMLAFSNTLGRVMAGYMSDKLGIIKTIVVVFIITFIGQMILYFGENAKTVQFYAGIISIGFAFGSIMGIFPGFTVARFGPKNNSVNYGIIFIGFAVAGYFGPTIMSSFYSRENSYQPAFLAAAGLALVGLGLTLFFHRILYGKHSPPSS